MAPTSKPEMILKQAEGLISVGQTHAALQALTEMFGSKRIRSTPLTTLEPIMMRFVDLCVELGKGRTAKEGLMQYKNIAQNTSVASVEAVITRFILKADEKVRVAQARAAEAAVPVEVDDLEASETPESILLGAVSGDGSRDRTDRALVTPSLKFLWEAYRTSLETLKNNARLETIYQTIAQQAFRFCLEHQRKVEFRRLCDTLRLHLANVAKYAHQTHAINLGDADTLQHHLDTRFAQLNTSVALELWQEAFRSVEDVHNLVAMAKNAPRPAIMANYYHNLARIFLMSSNTLFHAAACARHYAVASPSLGSAEHTRLAGALLVAILAVPPTTAPAPDAARHTRLTALLGLNAAPNRAGLLREAVAVALKWAPPIVCTLYDLLEVDFDPLALPARIAPLLKELAADEAYAPYLPLLHRALLSRLLQQLSQVYETLTMNTLHDLVAPLREVCDVAKSDIYSPETMEAFVMATARRGELSVRIDHAQDCIVFVDTPFAIDGSGPNAGASTSATQPEGIQPTAVELVRTRLSSIAVCLHRALEALATTVVGSIAQDSAEASGDVGALIAAVAAERSTLALRRALISRRRELLSELHVRQEKEAASKRVEQERRERAEREVREREEVKRRDTERRMREVRDIEMRRAQEYAANLVELGILKKGEVEKLADVDTEGLISIQVQQIEKDKREMSERLARMNKRIDHVERAYRLVERPLLTEDYKKQLEADRAAFEALQEQRRADARRQWEERIETKRRLARMWDIYNSRRDELVRRRGEEFATKKERAHRKVEEEKAKRRKQILAQREAERLREEEEERQRLEQEAKEEQERREVEERERLERERSEQERREREEKERKEAEERRAAELKAEERAAAERKAREEERAKTNEIARLQARRAEEAEARRAAERAEKEREKVERVRPNPFGSARPVPTRAADATDGWRRSSAAPATAVTPPSRPETPAAGEGKFRPGGGKGWREREAARQQQAEQATRTATGSGNVTPARAASPAPEPTKDEDGFIPVPSKQVWKPRRLGRV
ncbi:hypothetical protein FISHEDRAFT_53973 [Fistulina hepatica ATCC 64428]|uniref:Eukaryotic translation initiation factor 3 subunit A n=1 Tax=Fistulina hepatica ATCC 64428 TaxID=1128425 RepID=A0A0D6ZZD5_9AGAR|nr:hypothetical protein FISHEDRAFT_53973 [Fistulina hepatica ATCC 64428]